MDLYNQLRKDLNPAAGIDITVNKDLSINAAKKPVKTLTGTYRDQLKIIAKSVDVNANTLLNMLTGHQLDQVVILNEDTLWHHPKGNAKIQLNGITKAKDVWWLEFEHVGNGTPAGQHQLHDLDITEVLGFMESIETVLTY